MSSKSYKYFDKFSFYFILKTFKRKEGTVQLKKGVAPVKRDMTQRPANLL